MVRFLEAITMERNKLDIICANEIIDIFGEDYIRNNFDNSVIGTGYDTDETYMYFMGFKSEREYNKGHKNHKGWTVYALVRVNSSSGKVVELDFQKEI